MAYSDYTRAININDKNDRAWLGEVYFITRMKNIMRPEKTLKRHAHLTRQIM